MKKLTNYFFNTLNREEMTTLTTTIPETMSMVSMSHSVRKNFSAADLWNIQRHRRTFVQRRLSF